MKLTLKSILGLLVCAVIFTACEEDEATQPVASVSVDKNLYDTNETMTVKFTGSAENVVIFTGDKSHDYELREQSNTGLIVNKGLFTYAYQQPGTFKVVCVATNHADEGQSIKTDTCSFYVKVVDDVTEIEKLSAPAVLYDEVYASQLNDTDWLLEIPRQVKYRTSHKTAINIKKQKLKFYLASDSTKIEVNGAPFSSNTQYDLSKTADITLTSHAGTVRDYKLYTVNYGEFETFTLAGKKMTKNNYTRTEEAYDYAELNIAVAAGVEAPTFDLYDNEKVYVDGVEQISGVTTQDFSQPVTYTFEACHPDRPDIIVRSTVVVTATGN